MEIAEQSIPIKPLNRQLPSPESDPRTIFMEAVEQNLYCFDLSKLVVFPLDAKGGVIDNDEYQSHPSFCGFGLHCALSRVVWIELAPMIMGADTLRRWNQCLDSKEQTLTLKSLGGNIIVPRDTLVLSENGLKIHIFISEYAFPDFRGENKIARGVSVKRGMFLAPTPASCTNDGMSNYIAETGFDIRGFNVSNEEGLIDAIRTFLLCYAKTDDEKIKIAYNLETLFREENQIIGESSKSPKFISRSTLDFTIDLRRGVWKPGELPSRAPIRESNIKDKVILKEELFEDYELWCRYHYEPVAPSTFAKDVGRMTGASVRQRIDDVEGDDKRVMCFLFTQLVYGETAKRRKITEESKTKARNIRREKRRKFIMEDNEFMGLLSDMPTLSIHKR